MEKHYSPSIYKTYITCIALLILCFIGAGFLKERTFVLSNILGWNPEEVSVADLGFTNPNFEQWKTINKQVIEWNKQKYIVVFTYSLDTSGSAMFLYGPDAWGKAQLLDMLILSNGADNLIIDRIPEVNKLIDINSDGIPELIINIGTYADDFDQYTMISFNQAKNDLVWNGWIDKDKDTQKMVDKGHIVFISGLTDAGSMDYSIDPDSHSVFVYWGENLENGEKEWTSVRYELMFNKFVFKSIE